MPSLGPAEILVVLVIALLVFGPDKMPDIARQVGKGMREFERVQQHLKSEFHDVVSEFDAPTTTPTLDADPVPMLPPKDDQPRDGEPRDGEQAPEPVPPVAETPVGPAPAAEISSPEPSRAVLPAGDGNAEPTATEPGSPAEPA